MVFNTPLAAAKENGFFTPFGFAQGRSEWQRK